MAADAYYIKTDVTRLVDYYQFFTTVRWARLEAD